MQTSNISLIDLYLISPGIVVFLSSIFILMLKVLCGNKDFYKGLTVFLAVGSLFSAWLLSLSTFKSLGGQKLFAFSEALVFDSFTYWSGSAVFLAAGLSLFLVYKSDGIKDYFSEFIFLFMNSVLGVLIVIWSHNLLILFMGIELVSLPLYTMVLLSRRTGYTKESAVKYYILGSVASAFFLLGMVLVYGSSSNQYGNEVLLNISNLFASSSELMKVDHLFLVGTTFMLLSSLLKLGVVPLHNWVPDVYQGADTAVTYYMLTVVKISAVVVLLKLMSAGFLMEAGFFQQALQWIAVLSMVFGALFALSQESVKRIFAYSGIAHSGYMLMSILSYGFDGEGSVDSLVFYFFPYVFFSTAIFYVLQSLENQKGADVNLSDLAGLYTRWPKESFILLVGVFGVSGMPPFVGFATKIYLLKTSVQGGFYWVVFWALIAAAISMVYYINIINRVYFHEYKEEGVVLWEKPLLKRGFSILSSIFVTVFLLLALFSIYYFPVNS